MEYSCGFWVQKELVSPTDILGKAVCEDLPNQKEIHPFHAQLIRSFTSKGFVFSEKVENTKEPILIQKIEIRTEIIRRGPISDLIHGLLFGLYPAIDNYRIIMHHKVVNKKGDVKFEYRASRTVEVYWSSFFYLAHPFMDKPNFEFADIINVLAEDSIQKAIESDVYENF
ncbi:hypothetical protein [Leptospira sarikeiensis]|uniref:Uncharacterized protein n=1 Tax=Leptospira sarikeiensis TaxID=2484943 RepID=A0A4R9K5D3_9LEPT|nr:hypothetical protein [Leptospira sarikeiensis]TGL59477.1 hypothetical protein EHQ64_15395 [Leptospira sarikeiensis]